MNNKRYLKMTEKVANRSEIKIKLIMHIVKIGMNQFDAGLLRWWETSREERSSHYQIRAKRGKNVLIF